MAKDKSCCGRNVGKGILFGLIPHVGCILFIIVSILGTTVLMQYFKPLLMNRNIFYYLILVSIGFASVSSFFYLRKNDALSFEGIRKKKGYLFSMYGFSVGVNVLLFFFVFPFLSNFVSASVEDSSGLRVMNLEVDIPCPGHAPLISSEVSGVNGVKGVEYSFPNKFEVFYEAGVREDVLGLDVFEEYPAEVVSDEVG